MIGKILQIPNKYGFLMALLVSVFATIGSLYFSEVEKLPPCDLCWYQRIFMYPQAIILLIANLKEDYGIKKYVIPLSVFGLLVAIYNEIIQINPLLLPCTSFVPCSTKYLNLFGFITIPLLSAVAFLSIIILTLLQKDKMETTAT